MGISVGVYKGQGDEKKGNTREKVEGKRRHQTWFALYLKQKNLEPEHIPQSSKR